MITFNNGEQSRSGPKRPYNLGLKYLRYSRFCLNGLQAYTHCSIDCTEFDICDCLPGTFVFKTSAIEANL